MSAAISWNMDDCYKEAFPSQLVIKLPCANWTEILHIGLLLLIRYVSVPLDNLLGNSLTPKEKVTNQIMAL